MNKLIFTFLTLTLIICLHGAAQLETSSCDSSSHHDNNWFLLLDDKTARGIVTKKKVRFPHYTQKLLKRNALQVSHDVTGLFVLHDNDSVMYSRLEDTLYIDISEDTYTQLTEAIASHNGKMKLLLVPMS